MERIVESQADSRESSRKHVTAMQCGRLAMGGSDGYSKFEGSLELQTRNDNLRRWKEGKLKSE